MPEGILGVKTAVFECGVFDILEGILAIERDVAENKVIGTHHEVLALNARVAHFAAARRPAELGGGYVAVGYIYVGALAQGLDSVELAVADADVLAVPECGAALVGELAVGYA